MASSIVFARLSDNRQARGDQPSTSCNTSERSSSIEPAFLGFDLVAKGHLVISDVKSKVCNRALVGCAFRWRRER
jgi:hypothetical protein